MTHFTTYIAYAPSTDEMNLGEEYNRLIASSPTEWVCFLDHDATWLRRDWYTQIAEHITEHPNVGLLTVQANRIGNPAQRIDQLKHQHDITKLRTYARRQPKKHRQLDSTEPVSGVVIVTSKTAHAAVGGFKPGFLGVDNEYHRALEAAGLQAHLLLANPVYHWYRAQGDRQHLDKANRLWHNYHP